MTGNAHPSPPLRITPAIAALCTLLWALSLVFRSPESWRNFLLMPAAFSPLSMFTAPLIHLSAFHLGFNLVLLGLFGPPLERRLGPWPYLLLYLGSGLLAALLHLSISLFFQVGLDRYASGASGALAGLMGAYTVLFAEVRTRERFWLMLLVVAWILWELMQGCIKLLNGVEDVAHWAHIGGFLFGLIITVAMGQGAWAADHLLTEGQQLLQQGQYTEAERLLERAWSLQPHDPATILSLARAKQGVGSGETARELLAGALEQEVRDGIPERALALYLESRPLAPRLRLSPESLFRIAGWLGERGAWAEACTALERAAGPSSSGVRSSQEGIGTLPGEKTGDQRPVGRDVASSPTEGARLPGDELTATALFRAAELALTRLEQPQRAVVLLERLLREHPASQWRALAERSLRQLKGSGDVGNPALDAE